MTETIEVTEPRAETASRWAEGIRTEVPLCACGCGSRVEVKPQHRAPTKGVPRYVQGHHPNPLRVMYREVEKAGLLLTADICRALGISESRYHRLETAGVFPSPQRWKRWPRPDMRVFSGKIVAELRRRLRGRRRPA